jgi:hypothetical protein
VNLEESYRIMKESADPFEKTAAHHRAEAQLHSVARGIYSANGDTAARSHEERTQASAYAHDNSAKAIESGLFADHDRAAHAHAQAATKNTGDQAAKHTGFAAWHRARSGSVNAAQAYA